LVDTCGTGGGAVTTSTSRPAALLAAGAGVRIANTQPAFTSQCGSADVLEALGVAIEVPKAAMERALGDAGIVFMFAPLMHPRCGSWPVRRELGCRRHEHGRPLANPARAGRQVVGVSDQRRVTLMAARCASWGLSTRWSCMANQAWTKFLRLARRR